MRKITVLFTAVCGMPTCATIDSLRAGRMADYTVIGVDCSPNDSALNYVDFLYKVPRCKDPGYISSILEICRSHGVDVLVPLISDEINVLWEHMDDFERIGTRLLLSGKDSLLHIANDKLELKRFLEKSGIDIMPKTYVYDERTVDDSLAALGYPDKPVAFKLKDGCGAVGFKILDEEKAGSCSSAPSRSSRTNPYISKEQLVRLGNAQSGRYLLQEYLTGRELILFSNKK